MSVTKLPQFTPQGLANLCQGLSGAGVFHGELAAAVAKDTFGRIGDLAVKQLEPRDYVGVLSALAPLAALSSASGKQGF